MGGKHVNQKAVDARRRLDKFAFNLWPGATLIYPRAVRRAALGIHVQRGLTSRSDRKDRSRTRCVGPRSN